MPDQVLEGGGRELPIGVPGTIVFNRMRDDHDRAARLYRIAGVASLVVGLLFLLAGLIGGGNAGFWLVIVGAMTASCSIFPFDEALQQAERADGINVLREEWVAAGADPAVATIRSQIIDLIFSLYAPKKSG